MLNIRNFNKVNYKVICVSKLFYAIKVGENLFYSVKSPNKNSQFNNYFFKL